MASLYLTIPNSSPPSFLTPKHAKNPRQRSTNNIARRLVPCRATSMGKEDSPNPPRPSEKLDRRDVLLGLGGLAGLASGSPTQIASANPIEAPTQKDCHRPTDLPKGVDVECCPPKSSVGIKPYTPTFTTKMRVRQAAHSISRDNLEKFKTAVQMMKDLPEGDPRSLIEQGKVHCAYCNDGYYQPGYESEKLNIQVHDSWLFFPFHRWELYFFEKILGELINDENFAMPFWNWDNPRGMYMPEIYADPASPLYDQQRNRKHLPPKVVDLLYKKGLEFELTPEEQIQQNLYTMYKQMVSQKTWEGFMGKPFIAGDQRGRNRGSLEDTPHNKLHVWGGNPNNPNGENLGNFYSAGNDPLFYALHGNVDRLWSVWKTLEGPGRTDPSSSDWQDATYAFYNEKKELVKVRNGDCVKTEDLGYVYENVAIPWKYYRPTSYVKNNKSGGQVLKKSLVKKKKVVLSPSDFPLTLDKAVSVSVPRPKKRRSRKEKDEQIEVLSIEVIEYDKSVSVSFEVYINDEDEIDKIGPGSSEFLATFSTVQTGRGDQAKGKKGTTGLLLAITEALEDLDAEDDDTVIISLVPKTEIGKVKIGSIKIELLNV